MDFDFLTGSYFTGRERTKNKRNSPLSQYEREKLKPVEENNLVLLKQNIVSYVNVNEQLHTSS